ncbi:12553_t:CDS:2, partial [Entrophospora sp. SA101]
MNVGGVQLQYQPCTQNPARQSWIVLQNNNSNNFIIQQTPKSDRFNNDDDNNLSESSSKITIAAKLVNLSKAIYKLYFSKTFNGFPKDIKQSTFRHYNSSPIITRFTTDNYCQVELDPGVPV